MSTLQAAITISNNTPMLLPVSKEVNQCIVNELNQQCKDNPELLSPLRDSNRIVFNFRDKNYNAKNGGFHPVEIGMTKEKDNNWQYAYITDFAYVGIDFPELTKEIDFDFLNAEWFASYEEGYSSIKNNTAASELYGLWECNFLAYVDMDAYDDITISFN